jgi:hypothetical protein
MFVSMRTNSSDIMIACLKRAYIIQNLQVRAHL